MTGQADFPGGGADGPDTWIRPPAVLRTLIVGAGRAGQALARDLCADHGELHPIGFLDDADQDRRRSASASATATATATALALPRLGTLTDLGRLIAEHEAEAVVLAIPALPTAETHELADTALGAGAVVRYLPWHTAVLSREVTGADLRPLDIRALIDGPKPHVVSPEVKEIITGKRVLVTGAGSPLGSEICRQLHAFIPGALFLLDADESALRRLRTELWGEAPLDDSYAALLTTDIRDRDQTDRAFRDLLPEVVFHTSGIKHASMLERRPSHGVLANVLGTDNLVRAATRHGTERFIQISADADPVSMLGASQRVAEAVVLAAPRKRAKRGADTVFATVRIGDVLDSRDSLLTALADQIRAGGPVTLTNPDATRCFATVEEAAALALDAARLAAGGEIHVLDLGEPTRVTEVVSRFTRQYGLPEVPIRYAGLRHKEIPRPADRIPTAQPQIFTTTAAVDPAEYAQLPDRLDRLYKAAAKNRDPKVRQMLLKLSASIS